MIATEVTSLSSKGQIVIPNEIRKAMHLAIGAKLMIMTDGSNLLLKSIEPSRFEEFQPLIVESRKFAKSAKLKKADVSAAIRKVRSESSH